jgi:stage II sporulation protein D
MRRLALAVTILSAACAGTRPEPAVSPTRPAGIAVPDTLRVRVDGRIRTVRFEDYVAATALSEITPVNESPATVARIYDVQTILARTYALSHLGRHKAEGFDLCDSTHCQLYEPARLKTSRFADAVTSAISRTAGTVLTFRGVAIEALFHADCGGHTATPTEVWGSAARPYLPSASDEAPGVAHRTWSVTLTRDDLKRALDAGRRTSVGRSVRGVLLDGVDDSGRVSTLTVIGDDRVVLRSDDFRALVNRQFGPRAVMSTRFQMTRRGDSYVLNGTGFGHGVGLCQVGALAWARQGRPAAEILGKYFPGARVSGPGGTLP